MAGVAGHYAAQPHHFVAAFNTALDVLAAGIRNTATSAGCFRVPCSHGHEFRRPKELSHCRSSPFCDPSIALLRGSMHFCHFGAFQSTHAVQFAALPWKLVFTECVVRAIPIPR
jgi:hypothetical protein